MSITDIFSKWDAVETHSNGNVVLSEDDSAEILYVVLSGEVELSLNGTILGKESAGGIIGEMAVIEADSGNPTVKALGDVKLARLDREQFDKLMTDNSEFSMLVMRGLANRLRSVNAFVSAQLKAGKIK